jgi:UDP-N-acetylglucosamine--N-acetylmuramyl-(pentapeptide) pyrophosphoryl-undecaprenol N-acetylglucosamine transferase
MAVRTMLAASTGGHLDQLIRLRPRLGALGQDVVWATFDTPQSRSRLDGEEVVFVRPIEPRDYGSLARSLQPARRTLRDYDISAVVSTGSGIALSFMPMARAHKLQCHYVESAARSQGPSLTGRLLTRVHGMKLYTQYRAWAGGDWRYAGSVFDGFSAGAARPDGQIRKVVVTLGMIKPYEFRSMIERLLEVLPPEAEVLWQTGCTDTHGLPIDAQASMPAHEMDQAMREADLVVAHSGIGSSLAAMEAGHTPILVPRRVHRGEHVDDHQQQIAAELSDRGLALAREVEDLTLEDLVAASKASVERSASSPPLELSLN